MPNEENLEPGNYGDRTAGRTLLVEAIAAALVEVYQNDGEIRRDLGKLPDFQVTEQTLEAFARLKAEKFYNGLLRSVVQRVTAGEEVQIAGFGTFRRVDRSLVDVKRRGGNDYPIMPEDVIVSETRVAVGEVGGWRGGVKARYALPGQYAAGSESSRPLRAAAHWRVFASGSPSFVRLESNTLRIEATGRDDVTRFYEVGGLDIVIRGHEERVYSANGEYTVDFVTEGDQSRPAGGISAAAVVGGVPAGFAGGVVAGGGEYAALVARGVSHLSPAQMANEVFNGVPAECLPGFYPRKARVIRMTDTEVYDVEKIKLAEFWDKFAGMRSYLVGRGAWPERSRNFFPSVSCEFSRVFVADLNAPE